MTHPLSDVCGSVCFTPDEASRLISPRCDVDLLTVLAERLLDEIEPGKYDAIELTGLCAALAPWLTTKPRELRARIARSVPVARSSRS